MQFLPDFTLASGGSDIVKLITGLAWPVLVAIVVVLLLPSIRKVIQSRAFTVKVGGMEISVQQASQQLASGLEDLREQVLKLDAGPGDAAQPPRDAVPAPAVQSPPTQPARAAGSSAAAELSPAAALSRLHRIVWVDDYPVNNAFEVDALQRKRIRVDQATSNAEALRKLGEPPPVDAVVTDVGRDNEGADAGLDLLRDLKARDFTAPVIIYASAAAVARTRAEAAKLGAYGTTSSATELMSLLAQLGLG